MNINNVYRNTDDEFIAAVKSSKNIRQVLLKLNCNATGGAYGAFTRRVTKLGIDTSHFYIVAKTQPNGKAKRKQVTDQQIIAACQTSQSQQGTLNSLGLNPSGSSICWLKKKIEEISINTSHWLGQGHLKGKCNPWTKPRKLEEILIKGSVCNTKLKSRLIKSGTLLNRCQNTQCGVSEWHGSKLSLHLDHINGDRMDNRLENLRLLCPNCHSLTPTYCRKKSSIKTNSV